MKTRYASCLGCGRRQTSATLWKHNCFGVRGHEDVYNYWIRKKISSAQRKIPFHITGAQMISLLEKAGITPADISNKDPNGFVLCRTNDEGAYEIGNVRFDILANNLREGREKRWKKN